MPAVTAKAPAKTILFGEHAVVYGYPAIAVPVSGLIVKTSVLPHIGRENTIIRFNIEDGFEETSLSKLDRQHPILVCLREIENMLGQPLPNMEITISSSIPIAAGLGSSAAIAVAVTRAVSEFLGLRISNEAINQIAYQSEVIQHGTPSGIDNTVIALNQPVMYIKGKPIQPLTIRSPFHIILADSGDRVLTKEVVASVGKLRNDKPEIVADLFDQIGRITRSALTAVQKGNAKLIGELMNKNHKVLQKLSVSSAKLDSLVSEALASGAYGAKLCGAGRGGFMVAVCDANLIEKIMENLLAHGASRVFYSIIGPTPEAV